MIIKSGGPAARRNINFLNLFGIRPVDPHPNTLIHCIKGVYSNRIQAISHQD